MFVKLRNIVLAACVFITFSIVTKFDVFYILRNPGAKSLNIHSRENNVSVSGTVYYCTNILTSMLSNCHRIVEAEIINPNNVCIITCCIYE